MLCVAGALGNYGGPTETMALLPGSPAIGAGIALSGVTTDQRGEPLDSPAPDIGAYQTQGFTVTPVAGSTPQAVAAGDAFANPLAVTEVTPTITWATPARSFMGRPFPWPSSTRPRRFPAR